MLPKLSFSPNRLLVLQVLAACLSGLLIPLSFTGPAVVLPALAHLDGASPAALNWVVNAYIFSYGSVMMVAGSLTDLLGRRRVWLTGLALFCGATLAIALARSVPLIAMLRLIQGLGGAAAFAAAMSSLAPLFSGAARNRVMSLLGATFGVGLAFGPLAAGATQALAGWPAVFYATGALGLLGLLLVSGSMAPDQTQPQARLDWPGAITFSSALALLTFSLLQVPEQGWRSMAVLLPGLLSLLLMAAFVRIERRTAQPLLDLSLFRQRRFVGVQVLGASPALLFIVLIVLLPGRLIGVDGMNALAAGQLMMALAAPLLCVPLLAPLLLRWLAAAQLCAGGLLLTALGLAWLAQALQTGAGPQVVAPLLLIGAGIGLPWGLMDAMALGVVESGRAGMATGIFNTVRICADGLALAIAGAVLAGLIATQLAQNIAPHPLPVAPLLEAASRAALGQLQQAAQLLDMPVQLLYQAYQTAFYRMLNLWAALAVATALLILALLRVQASKP